MESHPAQKNKPAFLPVIAALALAQTTEPDDAIAAVPATTPVRVLADPASWRGVLPGDRRARALHGARAYRRALARQQRRQKL